MSNEEIINGNRLIAEFEGWSVYGSGYNEAMINKDGKCIWPVQIDYHFNWQSLMPVWLKIQKWYTNEYGMLTSLFEASSLGIEIKANDSSGFKYARASRMGELTIDDFYITIVEFLKWHNQTRTT